jgi:hypothetical protein
LPQVQLVKEVARKQQLIVGDADAIDPADIGNAKFHRGTYPGADSAANVEEACGPLIRARPGA